MRTSLPLSVARARPRTRLALLALVLAATLVAGACSSDDDTDTATADAVAPATTIGLPTGPPPEEPGPYAVGRTTVTLTDPDRGGRTLTTDVWFPVDPAAAEGAAASTYVFIPGIQFDAETAKTGVAPSDEGPFPLVVFSHGSGGIRYQSAFFTERLASHGFVVAAPEHTGNTAYDTFLGTSVPQEENAVNRPADAAFVIDALLAGADGAPADLVPTIDPERIGIGGHSAGGYTGLATASGRPTVPADERVRAVLGLAPATRGLSDAELEAVDVPTMLISGTLDTTTPIPDNTVRPWDLISGRPLYRVDLTAAGHQSFTDVCDYQVLVRELPNVAEAIVAAIDEFAVAACTPEFLAIDTAHQLIARYGIAFFQSYVEGDAAAGAWLTPEAAAETPDVTFQVKE